MEWRGGGGKRRRHARNGLGVARVDTSVNKGLYCASHLSSLSSSRSSMDVTCTYALSPMTMTASSMTNPAAPMMAQMYASEWKLQPQPVKMRDSMRNSSAMKKDCT